MKQFWVKPANNRSLTRSFKTLVLKNVGKWFLIGWFLAGFASPLLGQDELWLTGKVLTYDVKTGLIKVDVKSESCPGVRTFEAEAGLPESALVGKEIHFGIDSSTCKGDRTYKIRTKLIE
jgi:hypothetical protein